MNRTHIGESTLSFSQPQPIQTKDLDAALQDLAEEYCTRIHEHLELTLRSVEYPHCVATVTYHPRDCRCDAQEKPDKPISDVWLRLFERDR